MAHLLPNKPKTKQKVKGEWIYEGEMKRTEGKRMNERNRNLNSGSFVWESPGDSEQIPCREIELRKRKMEKGKKIFTASPTKQQTKQTKTNKQTTTTKQQTQRKILLIRRCFDSIETISCACPRVLEFCYFSNIVVDQLHWQTPNRDL